MSKKITAKIINRQQTFCIWKDTVETYRVGARQSAQRIRRVARGWPEMFYWFESFTSLVRFWKPQFDGLTRLTLTPLDFTTDLRHCHVCWPRLTAKHVEPVVSISWASCCRSDESIWGYIVSLVRLLMTLEMLFLITLIVLLLRSKCICIWFLLFTLYSATVW